MPSPIGHGIIGLTIAIFFILKKNLSFKKCKDIVKHNYFFIILCVIFANIPDIDFVPGLLIGDLTMFHRGITHSIFFIFIISLITAIFTYEFFNKNIFLIFTIFFLCGCSHLLMDMADGLSLLFYPIYNQKIIMNLGIFNHVSLSDVFSISNTVAIVKEIIITGSVLFSMFLYKFWKGL